MPEVLADISYQRMNIEVHHSYCAEEGVCASVIGWGSWKGQTTTK